MKKSISPRPFVAAMPVVLVAVKNDENINFATHGMYGQLCNEPPLIYISVIKNHLTAKMINNANTFSINIPNSQLLEKIKFCGNVTGIEKDKSQTFDVFYGENDVPMISECPVNMNCKVYKIIDTKDMFVFIGQVVEMYSDEECLASDQVIATKVDPLLCTIQGKFFKMGIEIE